MTPSPRSETMCQNGNVVVQENQGQTKSFRDVVTWFGLPGYPEGDAWNAEGPGINAAKRIWSSYSRQQADPTNDSPYGRSYIDIMIEVIQKVETRFEDPAFELQSVSGYCKRLLKDRAKAMKQRAMGGGSRDQISIEKEDLDIKDVTLPNNEVWLDRFRSHLTTQSGDNRTLQAALIFVNLVLEPDTFDLEDVPIKSQGATRSRYLMKCAIYLSTPTSDQPNLVSGAPATVSRRFKELTQVLDNLLKSALSALQREGDA